MDPLKKITELLDAESPRKRIAAAVILGELKVKDPQVVQRLISLAKDPLEAYAEAALEALTEIGSLKALPVFLDSLDRGRALAALAAKGVSALGEDALPEIKARLDTATPEARSLLSQLLPGVGGRASFEMALEGLRGQPWDSINKVALSVRQEARTMSEAERRVMKTQVEKFLEKKKTGDDEPALRGALKILGFLELEESLELLLKYLGPKQPTAIRVEAVTALRFAMSSRPLKKGMKRLLELLNDPDPLVLRAARESLTVLKLSDEFAGELTELVGSPDNEIGLWAIAQLGALAGSSKVAIKTLLPVARSADRTRAEAASAVLVTLPGGPALLVDALVDAEEDVGAQVLAEVLNPLAATLPKKDIKRLKEAGAGNLAKAFAVAKRQLEPVRNADPEGWAEVLREKVKAVQKKDPARADLISQLLGRSVMATAEDRFGFIVQQFQHHSLDPHPRARQRDPLLAELEKLHREGFKVPDAVNKEKKLGDDARYYVGVHFAEKAVFELKNIGAEVLEALAGSGKGKMAKAAKNKMKLLEL